MTNKLFAAVLTFGLLGSDIPTVFAQQALRPGRIGADFIVVQPEMHVRQRKALMVTAAKYYFPLSAMAAGEIPYDLTVATRNAAYLDSLSKMPWENFVESTVGVQNTNALPEIYKEGTEFAAAAENYRAAVEKLVVATKSGEEAGVKAAIRAIGPTCGTCHGTFRARVKL